MDSKKDDYWELGRDEDNLQVRTIWVCCPECGVDYDEEKVMFEDISEDIQGYDVLTFTCPQGHKHQKGLRRG